MKEHPEKHLFAFYVDVFSPMPRVGHEFLLEDAELARRLKQVIRMQIQEPCILFNRNYLVQVFLQAYAGKQTIRFMVQQVEVLSKIRPLITLLLPLLKKEHFETALYNAVELGVSVIQPVITQKTSQWFKPALKNRFLTIMAAAAEQSKGYAFADLYDPLELERVVQKFHAPVKIFFDPEGLPASQCMEQVQQAENFILMIGPEGDLIESEKQLLIMSGFTFCALTPTILRSVQAVAVGVGLIRSLASAKRKK